MTVPASKMHAYMFSRRPDDLFFFFLGGSRFLRLGSPTLGPGGPGGPCGLGGLGLSTEGAGGDPYVPPRPRLRSMLSASLDPDSTVWFMFPARRSWAVSAQRHIQHAEMPPRVQQADGPARSLVRGHQHSAAPAVPFSQRLAGARSTPMTVDLAGCCTPSAFTDHQKHAGLPKELHTATTLCDSHRGLHDGPPMVMLAGGTSPLVKAML